MATRGQRLSPDTTDGRDSMVVLDHCIRRIAGHCRLQLWALQVQSSNHIFSIRLSERHEKRMVIIILMLWSWVANINAYFTCKHFWQIPLFLVAYRSFVLLLFHKADDPSSLLLALLSALQVLIPYLSKLSSELNHWCYWYANRLQLGWGFLKSTPKCQSYRLQWAEWLVDPCSEIFVESALCIFCPPHPLTQGQHTRIQLSSVWLTQEDYSHVPTSESDEICSAWWLQQSQHLGWGYLAPVLDLPWPSVLPHQIWRRYWISVLHKGTKLYNNIYNLCLEPWGLSTNLHLSQWKHPSHIYRSIKI